MKRNIILFIVFGFYLNSFSQAYFDVTKEYQKDVNYNADLKTVQHYSVAQLKTVFDLICKSGIEFNYPQGGCQNRAHTMSMMLFKKHNMQHFKVWLFSPADLFDGDSRALEINDKNQLAPNNTIKWFYHVAPCVLVDNKGKVETYVLDPSLDSTQPLLLTDWFKKIGNYDVSKYTFLTPDWYFFLTNNNGKITGEFYRFEADPRGWINNYSNLTLEKGLAINDLSVYILKKYILQLQSSKYQSDIKKLEDLKKVFGNVDALIELFGKQSSYMGSNVPDNIFVRILYEKYPELMNDAMKYYVDRVFYWTKEVGQLK